MTAVTDRMYIDFNLLFSSPFYLVKVNIHKRIAAWEQSFQGVILDVGCGSRIYQGLFKNYQQYIGMEVNTNLRPEVAGSALALPFAAKSVDNMVCLEVLEHLPEPELALGEMARVLRTGGKLLLSTPMTWYLHYEPHDYFRYTKYGLAYLLDKSGYRVVEINAKGGYWTIVLSRMVEVIFHFLYSLTTPIRWLTRKDRGRFRLAVILTLPFTLAALLAQAVLESSNSPYVQGWVVLAEKL